MTIRRVSSVDLIVEESWYPTLHDNIIYVPYGVSTPPTIIERYDISTDTLLSAFNSSSIADHFPTEILVVDNKIWVSLDKNGSTTDPDTGLIERYTLSGTSLGTGQFFSLISSAPRPMPVAMVTDNTNVYAMGSIAVSANPTQRRGGRVAKINIGSFSQTQEIGLTETLGNGWNSIIGFGVWAGGFAFFNAQEQSLSTGAPTGNHAILKISTPSLSHTATLTTTDIINELVTDGTYLYTAFDGSPGTVKKYDLNFNLLATYTLPGTSSPYTILIDTSWPNLMVATADSPPLVYVLTRNNLTVSDPLLLNSGDENPVAGISDNNGAWYFLSTDFTDTNPSRIIKLASTTSFGYRRRFHRFRNTGSTNSSISHDTPINIYTTTQGIGLRRKWILGASALTLETIPLPPFCGRQVQFTLAGPSTATFTVPHRVTLIYAECIGGGGDGDDAGLTVGGQGGGGGGYGAIGLAVSPGDTFSVIAGGPGITSTFGTGPDAQGDGGSTPAGGTVNIGSFTANGQDGDPGSTPNGGDGGAAPGGGAGGTGGAAATNGSPGIFPGGGGGGGGAASADGALGAAGQVRVTYASTYGLHGDIHQFHNTGQTNYSIMHCTPINQYTTTKGINIRRIRFAPSDLRVTQQYAEVFNVDPPPPGPNIRTTQYYFEVMEAPPGPKKFAAAKYRRMVLRAAGLATITPPPIVGCSACIGRYKVRIQQSFTGTGQTINRTQTLLERGLQYCHCNGLATRPAAPFNPEFLEESLYPPLPPPGPPIMYDEPLVGPPYPITPPLPPMVPPLPPVCPNNPPTLPITNLGTFHIVNQSDISDADIDDQIDLIQTQIDNSFAPYWGRTCTVVRSSETLLGIGYNIFIRNGDADIVACGYHIDKYLGLQKIGRVFPQYNSCQNWHNTLDHEILEMLGDPTPFYNTALGPVVTFMGKQGRFIVEVCDPVSHVTYNSGKLENFVYPSWFIPGSPCPWDRLGVLPGPMTFKAQGFMSFLATEEGKWYTVRGNPPTFGGA